MNDYSIDGVKVNARNFRTAVRRVRAFKRGELTIDGKTILAAKRKPKGTPMRKKPCGSSN